MGVPIAIFVVLLGAGVYASARRLPDLGPGADGMVIFFTVCGLLGLALAVLGLNIYDAIESAGELVGIDGRGYAVAIELTVMLWQSALLLGVAVGVYLVAPRRAVPQAERVPR